MSLRTIQNSRLVDGAKLDELPSIASNPGGTTLFLRADGAWVSPASSLYVVTVTGNYTLTSANDIVVFNPTAAATATLPTAVGNGGKVFNIKNISSYTITVDADGTETIDGELTQVLDLQYDSLQLASDGSNWYII